MTYDTVFSLKYLDAVYHECLRLYPPVIFFTARICTDNTVVNNIRIPKGVHVEIPVTAVHWNEEYWPNARQFDPERCVF